MNTITKIILGAVLVAVVFFYAGIKYNTSQVPTPSAGARSAFARTGATGTARGGVAGGAVSGTLLSVDPQGITVSVTGGASKIVFMATSTSIMKSTTGSLSDLTVGDTVLVTGQTNSDGSITARSIDVRPASPTN